MDKESKGTGQDPAVDKPLVSVLMNCFNGEAFLREAIDSVLAQTYENWELVFWDNQSTDKTAEICQGYSDPRIRYIYADEHTNLGAARVKAMKHVKGSLLAVLDADDVWLPNKLELQVPCFKDPDVGIVISDTIFFNDQGMEKQLYKTNPPPEGRVFAELATRFFVSLETVILRMEAVRQLEHDFDPDFNLIEDYDLIVRVGYRWKLAFVPRVLAKWRVHSNSWTWRDPAGFITEKARFIEKMDALDEGRNSDWERVRRLIRRDMAEKGGMASLFEGKGSECRRKLREFVFNGKRSTALYFLSFVPFGGRMLKAYLRRRNVSAT